MNHISSALLLALLSAPPSSPMVTPPRGLAVSASGEITRLVRAMPRMPRESRTMRQTQPQSREKGWVARHPKLFGAFVGFGAGCAVGASQVGGSQDNFFNALDEAACPVVGAIGAAAGALVGSLIK